MFYLNEIFSLINIIIKATEEVLLVYNSQDFVISEKEDKSPLTLADSRSHETIVKGLNKLSNYPILSEEGKEIPYEERKKWKYFWLIDPLDGTKEFIKKNGEFTINIALVERNEPVIGVVSVPVRGEIFFAFKGKGSYKIDYQKRVFASNEELFSISKKLPFEDERDEIIVVGSRSHRDEKTDEYIEKIKNLGKIQVVNIGSSYKICYLAEGKADIYPRFGKTMEWDISAGHVILEEAGGKIIDAETLEPLRYNKESLVNPPFIAKSQNFLKRYE
ncbi:MAG: 3'(2'),5'-bisphosphate nucleotidase CysQ [Proteobacteria bacterium]|nr:3'(2'),5'-bisphosphate nucleotidase CysQ [Pseudomonadota bacterium]